MVVVYPEVNQLIGVRGQEVRGIYSKRDLITKKVAQVTVATLGRQANDALTHLERSKVGGSVSKMLLLKCFHDHHL